MAFRTFLIALSDQRLAIDFVLFDRAFPFVPVFLQRLETVLLDALVGEIRGGPSQRLLLALALLA